MPELLNKKLLSYILQEGEDDCRKKIIVALKSSGATISDDDNDPRVFSHIFREHTGINVDRAIESVRKHYISNPATREWILKLPESKIKPDKKTGKLPKHISIPRILRKLVNQKDREWIVEQWNVIYSDYIEKGGVFRA